MIGKNLEKGRRSRCHPYLINITFIDSESDVNIADGEVLKIKKKNQQKPNTVIIISS